MTDTAGPDQGFASICPKCGRGLVSHGEWCCGGFTPSFDMFPDSAIDYLLENPMADHGENYKRMTDEDGNEVGSLGKDCGHHCGVITTGGTNKHTGHCNCPECHGPQSVEIDAIFTSESGGINPRGIV